MPAFGSTKRRLAELEAVHSAIDKVQAVIEFALDGTILTANENFLGTMGYTLAEIQGKHHSVFVDSAYRDSLEYRRFWDNLRAGKFDAARYRRFGKGGREVWIQASYNPLFDPSGKPYKVIKFAIDVTAQVKAQQALDAAVQETQSVVQATLEGASDRRISTAEKSGQLAALAGAVNSLIDNVLSAVGETRQVVQAAIEGQLTQRIAEDRKKGHFRVLAEAVNSFINNMMVVVGEMRRTAVEVESGASEISRGNTNLSQRTEEQASSLEETASSMEQMTSTIKQNADNAAEANQLAADARTAAESGGHVVSQAVTAMQGINSASSKIADIIAVIDDIAFQTNLLALNAAVEAARAGEQGRGFAVVATEVRNLASRSAGAAKEIKALIQDSVVKVAEGSKLVDRSGATLNEIIVAVKKVSDIVAEISAASQEQASGIEQVNRAVTSMDEATQQNAALVEQAAAAATGLTDQATRLNAMISRYQVGSAGEAAPVVRSSRPVSHAVERRRPGRPWSTPRSGS